MKNILIILTLSILAFSCKKDDNVENINVEGYWNILRDTTFTSIPTNASSDLYHLFKGEHAFYRLSFAKTHDFSVLTSRPRPDSLISFYRVEGAQLQIPHSASSYSNNIPGNNLIKQTADEMVFTRYVIMRRSTITGKILADRTDTIRYVRVTDPAKVAYFNNYLKTYHP